MRVLAFNCGSSSIKCAAIETGSGARTFELRLENLGRDDPRLTVGETCRMLDGRQDFAAAIGIVLSELRGRWADLGRIDAVAHRVVHGGERFSAPALIDADLVTQLGALDRLAPLHNPPATLAIRGARELFANLPHIAVFDTAF